MYWKDLFVQEAAQRGITIRADDLPDAVVLRTVHNAVWNWYSSLDAHTQYILNALPGVPGAIVTSGLCHAWPEYFSAMPRDWTIHQQLDAVQAAYTAAKQGQTADDWAVADALQDL